MLATEKHGYDLLVQLGKKEANPLEVKVAIMRALTAFLDGNPDPLEPEGFMIILENLDSPKETDEQKELVAATLDCVLNCCVRHEQNRQNLVRNGLLDKVDAVLEAGGGGFEIRVARIWQALVQDDDVRVPFGKAHDHAREIVEDHKALKQLVKAINGR